MTFEHDCDEQSSSDEEIVRLCEEAIEQIKKVNADSSKQEKEIKTIAEGKKKDIIIRLAKSFEGKIPINAICQEVVIRLRDYASEGFIRKCLDPKYKDYRRSKNASQQQNKKRHSKKMETETEQVTKDYTKAGLKDMEVKAEEERVEEEDDDNLALLGALDQQQEEEEEMEQNKIEEIIGQEVYSMTPDGQILIQRGNGRNSDDANYNGDSSVESSDKSPTSEKNMIGQYDSKLQDKHQEQQPVEYPPYIKELDESIQKEKDAKMKEWMMRVLRLEITNLELREILEKINQFQTADIIEKASKCENQVDDRYVEGEFSMIFDKMQKYLSKLFPQIGSRGIVWVKFKYDMITKTVIYSDFGRLGDKNNNEEAI